MFSLCGKTDICFLDGQKARPHCGNRCGNVLQMERYALKYLLKRLEERGMEAERKIVVYFEGEQ